jgi:hypothetical protein
MDSPPHLTSESDLRSSAFGPRLERSAHLVEPSFGCGQDLARERDQDPREPLRLAVSTEARFERLKLVDVLPVEEAGYPEAPEPAERMRRIDPSHFWAERPSFVTVGTDDHS